MSISWPNAQPAIQSRPYVCGFCNVKVGPDKGFAGSEHEQVPPVPGNPSGLRNVAHIIYICSNCNKPTYFERMRRQIPGPLVGTDVASLPDGVGTLYTEARRALSASAPTAATMALRTLLAHVAVDLGAKQGLSFAAYVKWLAEEHYIPKRSEDWVDQIRQIGNDAVHDLMIIDEARALELLNFSEMILTLVYDYPSKQSSTAKS